MKRFTETTKWRDPWFRNLSPEAKLLWLWLLDHCDRIGIVEVELAAASFDIGGRIKEKHLTELVSRLQATETRHRYFISKFIPFQYGTLTPSCAAHKPVITAVHNAKLITKSDGYQYPSDTLPLFSSSPTGRAEETDKEKEEEEEKEKSLKGRDIPPTLEAVRAHASTIGLSDTESVRFHAYYESNGWKVGKNPMKSWHGAMITWRGKSGDGNGKPTNGANTIVLQKEFDRVLDRMKALKNSYSEHQAWSQKDVDEWNKLKARREELKALLGTTI